MSSALKMRVLQFCLFLFAAVNQAVGSINYEKPFSIQFENLTRWNKSFEARAIQQGLGERIKPRQDYPRVAEPFEGAKKWSFLYRRPFLVLDAEPNPYGGFWGIVVFENYPKVFGIWLYDLSKEGTAWEIRAIEPFSIRIPKLIEHQLRDKRVDRFWLKASITR